MRCKSIQTIAQGDAQSESSQSQSSTKHKTQKSEVRKISRMKWGTQKPNWTQLKRNIDGSGVFFSRKFRTTRAHIKRAHFICQPAKRKKFLSFSVLSAFCYICVFISFLEIYLCIEISCSRTPWNKFNCWGVCVMMVKRGRERQENVNNFIYVCFELVFIICQRQQPDVFRLNTSTQIAVIWFNTLNLNTFCTKKKVN